MTKLYRGTQSLPGSCHVVVVENGRERPLNPRYDLRNHSPDGFAYGYGGSGPAQLALAILCDALGQRDALHPATHYQDYKFAVIARLPQDQPFEITEESVRQWAYDVRLKAAATP